MNADDLLREALAINEENDIGELVSRLDE